MTFGMLWERFPSPERVSNSDAVKKNFEKPPLYRQLAGAHVFNTSRDGLHWQKQETRKIWAGPEIRERARLPARDGSIDAGCLARRPCRAAAPSSDTPTRPPPRRHAHARVPRQRHGHDARTGSARPCVVRGKVQAHARRVLAFARPVRVHCLSEASELEKFLSACEIKIRGNDRFIVFGWCTSLQPYNISLSHRSSTSL